MVLAKEGELGFSGRGMSYAEYNMKPVLFNNVRCLRDGTSINGRHAHDHRSNAAALLSRSDS